MTSSPVAVDAAPTHIQAHLFAQELTLKRAADDPGKLTRALVEARVDLNPHQVDAALFAFKNPLSKGATHGGRGRPGPRRRPRSRRTPT